MTRDAVDGWYVITPFTRVDIARGFDARAADRGGRQRRKNETRARQLSRVRDRSGKPGRAAPSANGVGAYRDSGRPAVLGAEGPTPRRRGHALFLRRNPRALS